MIKKDFRNYKRMQSTYNAMVQSYGKIDQIIFYVWLGQVNTGGKPQSMQCTNCPGTIRYLDSKKNVKRVAETKKSI